MITYLYWTFFFGITLAILLYFGMKLEAWKTALVMAAIVLLVGWGAYYFHFQQLFVKRWGGVMAVSVPKGEVHIAATWKDDNLWIENYNPKTNTCHFREYSKGNLLEGHVKIKRCNPMRPGLAPTQQPQVKFDAPDMQPAPQPEPQ